MPEQEPQVLLPYHLPSPTELNGHLDALAVRASERSATEDRLSALENEANNLRTSLGRATIEPAIHTYAPKPEAVEYERKRDEEARTRTLEIIDILDIRDGIPVVFSRQRTIDLDLAGSYDIRKTMAVQKNGGLLFLEEKAEVVNDMCPSSTRRRDPREPSIDQYLIGRGVSKPLVTETLPGNPPQRGFLLSSSRSGSWTKAQEKIEELAAELEIEQLRNKALEIIGDTAEEIDRFGDSRNTKELKLGEIALKISFYADLDEVTITEYLASEETSYSKLNLRKGEQDERARKKFKKGLALAKLILEQTSE